jgi:hypothetical protein
MNEIDEQEFQTDVSVEQNFWNRLLDHLPQENLKRDVLLAGGCGLFLAGVAIVAAIA